MSSSSCWHSIAYAIFNKRQCDCIFYHNGDMKTLADRLKEARHAAGLSQAALAKKAGVAQSTIGSIENGRNRGSTQIVPIARALGITPEWLQNGSGEASVSVRPIATWDNEDELEPDVYVFLPALSVRVSAGDGSVVWHIDEEGQKQAFRRRWIERLGIDAKCAATMVTEGDSMADRIQNGDSLVVDFCQKDTVIDGKVYVLVLQGELFVKRLFKEIDGIRIVSDNPDKRRYPDKFVPLEKMEMLTIVGRVVAVSGGV